LQLLPRSNPEEPVAPQASIFGGAKPVDTAAREKEIEERLEKERADVSRLPPRDTRSDDNRYGMLHRPFGNLFLVAICLISCGYPKTDWNWI
jgi:translation initiation factor 4B